LIVISAHCTGNDPYTGKNGIRNASAKSWTLF
jgi:hypothetical protein